MTTVPPLELFRKFIRFGSVTRPYTAFACRFNPICMTHALYLMRVEHFKALFGLKVLRGLVHLVNL